MTAVGPEWRAYALIFHDGTRSEFRAENVTQALVRVKTLLPEGEAASLVEDGAAIARISHSPEGFWSVSSPPPGETRPARNH